MIEGLKELLQSLAELSTIIEAGKRVDRTDYKLMDQMAKFGVCMCSCHFNDYTTHTPDALCCSGGKTNG